MRPVRTTHGRRARRGRADSRRRLPQHEHRGRRRRPGRQAPHRSRPRSRDSASCSRCSGRAFTPRCWPSATALAPVVSREPRRRRRAAAISRARWPPCASATAAGRLPASSCSRTAETRAASDLRDGTPPVYAIGIGARTVGRDREVLSVTAAEAVFDDSRVDLAVSAVSHGHGTEPFALRLLENGRPIEVRRAAPAADGVPVREIFQVSPAPRRADGLHDRDSRKRRASWSRRTTPAARSSSRRRAQRRILFVEGAPGFEHSFLKRAWATDSGLEVDSVVRKGKNEQGADTFYIQASRSRSDALMTGYPKRAEDLVRVRRARARQRRGDAARRAPSSKRPARSSRSAAAGCWCSAPDRSRSRGSPTRRSRKCCRCSCRIAATRSCRPSRRAA